MQIKKKRRTLVHIIGSKYTFTTVDTIKLKNRYKLEMVYLSPDELSSSTKPHQKPDIIVLNMGCSFPKEIIPLLTSLELQGVRYLTIENFLEKYLHKVYISPDVDKLDFLNEIRPLTKTQYIIKRAMDLTIATVLGILTLPLLVYATYRIKKESPSGPVIFKQIRIGKNAKPFICYKFRSMHTATSYFDPYTQDNDPRVFPWGKFMRKTRIDELPQLWNVIRGDLHIIGPRAEWIELVKRYEKKWSFYHLRHLNAPGITGWAQVNYPYGRSIDDTYQKLMYDLYYIKNWSLGLEVKTLLKTVRVVLRRKGV